MRNHAAGRGMKRGLHIARTPVPVPFHADQHQPLKIYPDRRRVLLFRCAEQAGTHDDSAAMLHGIPETMGQPGNWAGAFAIPIREPVTYREKREADKRRRRRKELAAVYRPLPVCGLRCAGCCCVRRSRKRRHFWEGPGESAYVEYLMEVSGHCPEEVCADKEEGGEKKLEKSKDELLTGIPN
ncbi:MAG: hypothetical protein ACLSEY_01735 [Enterocloster sp.]